MQKKLIENTKNTLIYWITNMFAAITGCLLIFFATIGIVVNFNLPEGIYILKGIMIPLDIIICIILIIALWISIRIIRDEAKTELLLEILRSKKGENDGNLKN